MPDVSENGSNLKNDSSIHSMIKTESIRSILKAADPRSLGKQFTRFMELKESVEQEMLNFRMQTSRVQASRMLLKGLLESIAFDYFMGLVILLNVIVIIVDSDHSVISDTPLAWTTLSGNVMLGIFVVELALRVFVFRSLYFADGWNTFDFCVVASDASFTLIGAFMTHNMPISVLRVFRIGKLARVSKLFRIFPELRVMMAGLVGSFRAIFWGTVLLVSFLLVWGILAVQFIHPIIVELSEQGLLEECGGRCKRAYSSVAQAVLTFIQQIVTGDSWGQATIPVIEARPESAIFFAMVFMSVGFAVMNLMLAVIVSVAQSAHEKALEEIMVQERMKLLGATHDLLNICRKLDKDGSGELSRDEIVDGFSNREDFREVMNNVLKLEKEDLLIAYESMDQDDSGEVSYQELCKKLYQITNDSQGFMIEKIKYHITHIKRRICDDISLVRSETQHLARMVRTVENPEENAHEESTKGDWSEVLEQKEVKPVYLANAEKTPGAGTSLSRPRDASDQLLLETRHHEILEEFRRQGAEDKLEMCKVKCIL